MNIGQGKKKKKEKEGVKQTRPIEDGFDSFFSFLFFLFSFLYLRETTSKFERLYGRLIATIAKESRITPSDMNDDERYYTIPRL